MPSDREKPPGPPSSTLLGFPQGPSPADTPEEPSPADHSRYAPQNPAPTYPAPSDPAPTHSTPTDRSRHALPAPTRPAPTPPPTHPTPQADHSRYAPPNPAPTNPALANTDLAESTLGEHATSEPRAPLPEARVESGDSGWTVGKVIEEVPGGKFVSFLKISAKRAFRLRIEPTEVLPAERAQLEAASPPIVDSNLQAFLAWRRSVLFLVACALVPLTVIGFFDALLVGQATAIRVVKMAPVLAEFVFLAICWSQLRRWAHWRKQRRILLIGWVLFLATPFVVFIYPLRTVFAGGINAEDIKALNLGAVTRQLLPFKITMIAMLQLAPKAISLMPGLVRASLVIKCLFPGSPAPGWLIVIAAPIYALLAYVILIVPYQFTGSVWFIGGVLGIIGGQMILARSGFALAQPLTESEALEKIARVRKIYLTVMVSSAVLIIIALGSLVSQLQLHALDVILSVLKFEANVLILTIIGADLVIVNLDKARMKTANRDHIEEQAEAKIAAFVSLDSPHVPPPSGPAPTNPDGSTARRY